MLRRRLRRLLGVETLEERLHELEEHVRVLAGRSGETTALDLAVERLEALVAALPADEESSRRLAEVRRATSIAARADEIRRLHERIDELERRFMELPEETRERAKRRWRAARPDDRLTWHRRLGGDAFVDCLERWDVFAPDALLFEVGPGYGRIVRTVLARGLPFRRYTGLDLSAENVETLRRELTDPRLRFLHGDVEEVRLDEPVDVVYSSLTFKHLYPSCEPAFARLAPQLRPGGRILVDLVEGSRRYFEPDGVTYLRFYERDEIAEIVGRAGLELLGFDEVAHDAEHVRLVVVAARPAAG